MSNEYTKLQIRTWLENAVKKATNPDPAERAKRERQQKAKKVAQKYGII
jgi:hypothetical protein